MRHPHRGNGWTAYRWHPKGERWQFWSESRGRWVPSAWRGAPDSSPPGKVVTYRSTWAEPEQ